MSAVRSELKKWLRVGHVFAMSFNVVLQISSLPMNDVKRLVYRKVKSARSAVVRVTQYCTNEPKGGTGVRRRIEVPRK